MQDCFCRRRASNGAGRPNRQISMTAAESVRHTPCLARRDAPRIQYGRYIAADTHLRCAECLPFQSAGGLKAALQKRWKPPVWGRPPQRQRCVLRAQAIPDKEAGRAEHHHAVRFPHVPDVPACSPVLLTSHSGMKDTRSSCSLRLRKGQTEISMDTAGTSAAAISAPTGTSAATGADATGAATGATAGDDPPTAPAIPSSMAS